MVLYNKMKVEDSVADHVLFMQVGASARRSPWTLDALASRLLSLRLFAGVPPLDVRRLVLKGTLRTLAPGEVLCREGEFHELLTIVLEGHVEQWSERIRILAIGPGSFFGEMAVMAEQAEPFAVVAGSASIVLELPKAAVRRLMDRSEAFRDTMGELYRSRALWTYARKPTSLGGFPEAALLEVLDEAELSVVRSGEIVVREGEPPRDALLVRSGFLRVSRGDTAILYLREGDVFGAMAFFAHERTSAFTVRASTRAEIIRIPGAVLQRVAARYPEALLALAGQALELDRVARSPAFGQPSRAEKGTVAALSVDLLVDAGLTQGKEVLVVDQNLCTNCQSCVDACGRRHGSPRLELRGLQVENLLFPTACRHCEDPVCLLCSVGGIVRVRTGEIAIVEERCIGCGACADRCPYGNIQMQPLEEKPRGILFDLIDLVRGGAARERALRELDPRVPKKASKCDLCAGHGDYACVTACPTGAAFRIDPREAFGLR
jgi:CRP-like cAMP-binding protein/Fe-S-cluster-containing dehydrogenase component